MRQFEAISPCQTVYFETNRYLSWHLTTNFQELIISRTWFPWSFQVKLFLNLTMISHAMFIISYLSFYPIKTGDCDLKFRKNFLARLSILIFLQLSS